MSGEGLSKIRIEGEKMMVFEDVLGMEVARKLANDNKVKAFGLLSSLLSRPKVEDIEIIYEEKRFDGFWRILGNSYFEYKRSATYKVPVLKVVDSVNLLDKDFVVDKGTNTFSIDTIEHCRESYKEEVFVDAQTDQIGDFNRYLSFKANVIESTEELIKDGAFVANLMTKPSFLMRQVLNSLVKPIKADQILDERISIDEMCLYFLPVYTFELHWKAKDKKVMISFDGVSGEMRAKSSKIVEKLKKSFTRDEMFEFGKEVANFLPGGGLAVMVGKKALDLKK